MKQKIILVRIDKLIGHERVSSTRLRAVRSAIHTDGVVRRPVIVERNSEVILDGHHRVRALRDLGAKRVPVAYVRYSDTNVRVYMRRKGMLMKMIKRAVIEMAKENKLFPSKTTRHVIHDRPMMKAVRLEQLLK